MENTMKKTKILITLVFLLSSLIGCDPAAAPTVAPTPIIAVPPIKTPAPLTATPIPPTATVVPLTNTPLPSTATAEPTATPTPEIPRILWDQTYQKTAGDMGEDVLVADDGGFYIAGTAGLDMDGTGLSGDIYLIRTDADGKKLWEKTYGGDKAEEGLSIALTGDGNLLLAGMTKSFGAGGADAYLVKVDPEGNEIWSQAYGGPLDEMVSVRALADGGFMLWGNIVNPTDIVADPGAAGYGGFAGRSNIYLAQVDAAGGLVWSNTFGDQNNLVASGGVPAADGGFVVLASLLRYPEPGDDAYLLKVDESGQKVWERTWEEETISALDLLHTADDQYLIAASYAPADDTARTLADFLFIKVDREGKDVWTSQFGDPTMLDYPMVVTQSADGGYIAAGDWVKDFSGRYPSAISVAKIASDGELVWEKTIKPAGQHNILRSWLQLEDGSCLLVGSRLTRQFEIYLMKVDVGTGSSAYLGQTPPGLVPQIFAPGLISTDGATEFAASFSPDGTELYFTRRLDGQTNALYETHLINGVWTAPAPVSFSAEYPAFEPHVTADNKILYFGWFRPAPAGITSTSDAGIWAVDRTSSGWSEARYVGEGMFVSSDQNGRIYVTSFTPNSRPRLTKVSLVDGRFSAFEDLFDGVHPAIAPDGSYLVYDDGDGNLTALFPQPDGSWGGPKSLARQNIPAAASIATISPDGKYLFYTYKGDLYWVSAEIITNLQK